MLNLFLALLLSSFGVDKLKIDEKDDEINKIQEAIDRIKKFLRIVLKRLTQYSIYARKRTSIPAKTSIAETLDSVNHNNEILDHDQILKIQNSFNFSNQTDKKPSKWSHLRQKAFDCVEHKYFEFFIIIMIIISSLSLVY